MRTALRPLLRAFLVAFFLGGMSCVGDGDFCECVACSNAIALFVTDENGNEVADWVMEATLDGLPVDDFGACDPGTRTGSTCSFGTAAGLYRIVIRAPGFETRELAARFAAPSGSDCCQCLVAINVNAVLEAAE